MASWEVSPILAPLIADVKREFPGIVVGTIGDPAHQAEATGSDHNPDQYGFVCAADPMFGHGFGAAQAEALFQRLIALRDSRMAYVIYNRRIVSSTVSPWTVRSYTGSDPHTGHLHVSVKHSSNPRPTTSWNVYPPAAQEDDMDETSIAQATASKLGADLQPVNSSSGVSTGLRAQVVSATAPILNAVQGLTSRLDALSAQVGNVDEAVIAQLGDPSTPDEEVAAALVSLLGARKDAVLALMQ